jgi:Arc/MetJ-type ribon-helix-helix transcriptional regulator
LPDIDVRGCNKQLATAEFYDSISVMELTLGPETQRMLEEKLKEGRSADEVVQAGILALSQRQIPELDEDTLDAIDEAEDQIERGEVSDWDEVQARLRAIARKQ